LDVAALQIAPNRVECARAIIFALNVPALFSGGPNQAAPAGGLPVHALWP
jgi:hypothetical protein